MTGKAQEFARATANVSEITAQKKVLYAENFPPEQAQQLVAKIYRADAFAHFQNEPNLVFLPTPSTTGKNTLPNFLAESLQKDFGGKVVTDWAKPLEARPSYHKGILAKLAAPPRYELIGAVVATIDRNARLVLVDDVVTTGGSVQALREALAGAGLRVAQVAALAQSELRLTSARDMERIGRYFDQAEVRAAVATVLTGRLKQFANRIEQILPSASPENRERVANYFTTEAERLRQRTLGPTTEVADHPNQQEIPRAPQPAQRPLLSFTTLGTMKQLEQLRAEYGRALPGRQQELVAAAREVVAALPASEEAETQSSFLAGQFVRGHISRDNLLVAIDRNAERAQQRDALTPTLPEITPSIAQALIELDTLRERYAHSKNAEHGQLVSEALSTVNDIPGPDIAHVPMRVAAEEYVRGSASRERLEKAATDLSLASANVTSLGLSPRVRDQGRGSGRV